MNAIVVYSVCLRELLREVVELLSHRKLFLILPISHLSTVPNSVSVLFATKSSDSLALLVFDSPKTVDRLQLVTTAKRHRLGILFGCSGHLATVRYHRDNNLTFFLNWMSQGSDLSVLWINIIWCWSSATNLDMFVCSPHRKNKIIFAKIGALFTINSLIELVVATITPYAVSHM